MFFCWILQTSNREFLLRVSYMELYNEGLSDLLSSEKKTLQIRENDVSKLFHYRLTMTDRLVNTTCMRPSPGMILHVGNEDACLHATWWCPWNAQIEIYNFYIHRVPSFTKSKSILVPLPFQNKVYMSASPTVAVRVSSLDSSHFYSGPVKKKTWSKVTILSYKSCVCGFYQNLSPDHMVLHLMKFASGIWNIYLVYPQTDVG